MAATSLRADDLPQWGVVSVPVADLRSSSGSEVTSAEYDEKQESQLLYNENVQILEETADWLRVEAVEQQEFSHNKVWQGYPGWVKRSSIISIRGPGANFVVQNKKAYLFPKAKPQNAIMTLSLGTRLSCSNTLKDGYRKVRTVIGSSAWIRNADIRPLNPMPSEEWAREKIITAASEMLGDLYFWGGRSAHLTDLKNQVTAVDCSGLTNLAYRVAGLNIPRDSFEQHMKARKISPGQLKMGDLVFSASKDKPEKVSHVAIFVDSEHLIEAPKTGERVRKITFQEKYGVPLDQIKEGEPVGDRVLYFGTYFGNP